MYRTIVHLIIQNQDDRILEFVLNFEVDFYHKDLKKETIIDEAINSKNIKIISVNIFF